MKTHTEGPAVRRRKLVVSLALVAVSVVGSACEGDDGSASPAARANGADAEVVMELVAFKPEAVTVRPGSTVAWAQKDAGAHTVTSGTVEQRGGTASARPDGTFDSGALENGGTFRFTFAQAGTYEYFCSLHPATMRGQVRVQ